MKVPRRTASGPGNLVCPFCESGRLIPFGPGLSRCESCGLPLIGSALGTLRDVAGLPDVLGTRPCDCGHPEMRRLPDEVFHCPACRAEVRPVEARTMDTRGNMGSPPELIFEHTSNFGGPQRTRKSKNRTVQVSNGTVKNDGVLPGTKDHRKE
jgi:ribosomal protein L37AE/L43A